MLKTKGNGAVFSKDRRYRYALWRIWKPERGVIMFVCLNPSTADETEDDATVRRCRGYTWQWGYGGVVFCNLFAWRATKPEELTKVDDPVGPENDIHLARVARMDAVKNVVLGWGNHGMLHGRGSQVVQLLGNVRKLDCLRTTANGEPTHPLYLPRGLRPRRYRRRYHAT